MNKINILIEKYIDINVNDDSDKKIRLYRIIDIINELFIKNLNNFVINSNEFIINDDIKMNYEELLNKPNEFLIEEFMNVKDQIIPSQLFNLFYNIGFNDNDILEIITYILNKIIIYMHNGEITLTQLFFISRNCDNFNKLINDYMDVLLNNHENNFMRPIDIYV